MITSPHNEKLKLIRKLQARKQRERRACSWPRARTSSRPPSAAGRRPSSSLVRGSRTSSPSCWTRSASSGSGTRVIGVYRQSWSPPGGRPERLPAWRQGSGNVGDDRPRPSTRCRRAGGARARMRRSLLAEGGAGQHGVGVRPAAGAGASSPSSRHEARARRGRGRRPWRGGPRTPVVLCLGGEREGLPADVVAAADAAARIPMRSDAPDSLNVASAAAVAPVRGRE